VRFAFKVTIDVKTTDNGKYLREILLHASSFSDYCKEQIALVENKQELETLQKAKLDKF
jgi:hypothetical protein